MTLEEAKQIINVLWVNYPQTYKDYTAEQFDATASLWARKFSGFQTKLVMKAVDRYMDSPERFAPNVGQIKDIIREMITTYDAESQWCIIEFCVRSLPEGYSRYMREHLDPIAKELIWSGDVARFKETAGAMDKHRPRFMKEYEAEKRKVEEKAMETGDLMAITSPERIAELGLQPTDLMIEMKAPNV